MDDKEKPETYVVSRYLESPLLIGSRKFDLRIYALVLSYVPLKVYLHRSGHDLICTAPSSACVCATGVAEWFESLKDLGHHTGPACVQLHVELSLTLMKVQHQPQSCLCSRSRLGARGRRQSLRCPGSIVVAPQAGLSCPVPVPRLHVLMGLQAAEKDC